MFKVTIIDNNGKEVQGNLLPDATAAQHYAGCVYFLVDLLNGGVELNEYTKHHPEKKFTIGTKASQQSAAVLFIGEIHKHSAFAPDKVLKDKNHVNFPIFQGLFEVLSAPLGDTSVHIYLLELISKMQVPEIKSVKFTNDFTHSQEMLYRCNFPDELVPESYFCLLSSQVMDTPCFDKRNPEDFFDQKKFGTAVEKNSKNPYTNMPLQMSEIGTNPTLQNEIANFVTKIIDVAQAFPKEYNGKYQEFKILLQSQMPAEEFREVIKKVKAEASSAAKPPSLLAKEKNPLQLHQESIQAYKEGNFTLALVLAARALDSFKEKTHPSSLECLKCHSTRLSCYRELKQYMIGIELAEYIIPIFTKGETIIDMASIKKKYHECLKLQGKTFQQLYPKAVEQYNKKEFVLASYQLQYLVDFQANTLSSLDLAYCYSTLASCSRELKDLDTAITYCAKALALRKEQLKEGDPLILKTEQKLSELENLIKISIINLN